MTQRKKIKNKAGKWLTSLSKWGQINDYDWDPPVTWCFHNEIATLDLHSSKAIELCLSWLLSLRVELTSSGEQIEKYIQQSTKSHFAIIYCNLKPSNNIFHLFSIHTRTAQGEGRAKKESFKMLRSLADLLYKSSASSQYSAWRRFHACIDSIRTLRVATYGKLAPHSFHDVTQYLSYPMSFSLCLEFCNVSITDLYINEIAHPATKVKPPEWRIGSTKMAATVVANCLTDMTLFILILNLFLTLKLTLKTNSNP